MNISLPKLSVVKAFDITGKFCGLIITDRDCYYTENELQKFSNLWNYHNANTKGNQWSLSQYSLENSKVYCYEFDPAVLYAGEIIRSGNEIVQNNKSIRWITFLKSAVTIIPDTSTYAYDI